MEDFAKNMTVTMAHENFFNPIHFNAKPARVQTKSIKSYPNSTI